MHEYLPSREGLTFGFRMRTRNRGLNQEDAAKKVGSLTIRDVLDRENARKVNPASRKDLDGLVGRSGLNGFFRPG